MPSRTRPSVPKNGRGDASAPLARLPSFDEESGDLNAIVEALGGSRNKFKYDPKRGVFLLDAVLPAGATFPFDFGSVPSTRAADGDPLDVLVLTDEPTFVGAVVPARLVGALEAEQREGNECFRNDRLIAIARASRLYCDIETLDDVPSGLLDEIEHFWIAYNEMRGKLFTPLARVGAREARTMVDDAAI